MSRGDRLVEGGGQLAPVLARERVVDAELVQDADDDAAQVVAGAVGGGEGGKELVERGLAVAPVERFERRRKVGLAGLLEADACGQALGGEAPGGTGAPGTDGSAGGASGEKKKGDDVVDAEFVDVDDKK